MNTKDDEKKAQGEPLDDDVFAPPSIDEDGSFSVLTSVIAEMQQELVDEKDQRKEERFYWIGVCYILGMALLYIAVGNFAVFSILFLFGCIVLMGVANRLGVDWAVRLIGGLMAWVMKRPSK